MLTLAYTIYEGKKLMNYGLIALFIFILFFPKFMLAIFVAIVAFIFGISI